MILDLSDYKYSWSNKTQHYKVYFEFTYMAPDTCAMIPGPIVMKDGYERPNCGNDIITNFANSIINDIADGKIRLNIKITCELRYDEVQGDIIMGKTVIGSINIVKIRFHEPGGLIINPTIRMGLMDAEFVNNRWDIYYRGIGDDHTFITSIADTDDINIILNALINRF